MIDVVLTTEFALDGGGVPGSEEAASRWFNLLRFAMKSVGEADTIDAVEALALTVD